MITYEKIPDSAFSRLPLIKQIINEEKQIVFAYLFGGLSDGPPKPLSDIDIAVYLSNCSNISDYKLHLFNRLSETLNTAEIDLIILNTASTSLEGRILMKKIIIADKEPQLRYRYESLALRKFFDFQIKERQILHRRYGIG